MTKDPVVLLVGTHFFPFISTYAFCAGGWIGGRRLSVMSAAAIVAEDASNVAEN